IRDAVVALYEQHYSANLMTLTVIGAEPLDQLRKMVTEKMGPIRNTAQHSLKVDVPVLTSGQQNQRLDVAPFTDQRNLRLEFPFPWEWTYRLDKPGHYIGHLLGHEGEAGLHALLC